MRSRPRSVLRALTGAVLRRYVRFGLLGKEGAPCIPRGCERLVQFTHTFRHIFQRQTATADDRRPEVRIADLLSPQWFPRLATRAHYSVVRISGLGVDSLTAHWLARNEWRSTCGWVAIHRLFTFLTQMKPARPVQLERPDGCSWGREGHPASRTGKTWAW